MPAQQTPQGVAEIFSAEKQILRAALDPYQFFVAVRQRLLVAAGTGHEMVSTAAAFLIIRHRQSMADEPRLEAIVVGVGEPALVSVDLAPIYEVKQITQGSRGGADAQEVVQVDDTDRPLAFRDDQRRDGRGIDLAQI